MRLASVITLVAASAALAAAVRAQDATGLHQAEDDALVVQPLGVPVGDLDDMAIHGADGEEIGEVEAVLADGTGQPIGVAAEVGGFLGAGEKDVVIGLDRLTRDGDGLKLGMTREEIEALPEFDMGD